MITTTEDFRARLGVLGSTRALVVHQPGQFKPQCTANPPLLHTPMQPRLLPLNASTPTQDCALTLTAYTQLIAYVVTSFPSASSTSPRPSPIEGEVIHHRLTRGKFFLKTLT